MLIPVPLLCNQKRHGFHRNFQRPPINPIICESNSPSDCRAKELCSQPPPALSRHRSPHSDLLCSIGKQCATRQTQPRHDPLPRRPRPPRLRAQRLPWKGRGVPAPRRLPAGSPAGTEQQGGREDAPGQLPEDPTSRSREEKGDRAPSSAAWAFPTAPRPAAPSSAPQPAAPGSGAGCSVGVSEAAPHTAGPGSPASPDPAAPQNRPELSARRFTLLLHLACGQDKSCKREDYPSSSFHNCTGRQPLPR
ncbi:basic proline-rich protein-like [Lathamus discolor]|uniref:basic proline-rich protein-like n=1 Tax=Lathamus discolor TaxID=678569 RepID=UPI0032B8460C